MKEVTIYTDGACSGNPGPGGWGALLKYNGHEKEISGGDEYTTNQRMELKAALEALRALKEPCKVKLYSDSAYLINAFRQGWINRWASSGWLNAKKELVENRDLWEGLLKEHKRHRIQWLKVKGHSNDKDNERCDYLAREAVPKTLGG
ncbi:MAG: ribonuclease HI [Dethiobacteria bacterium]|jgi:ribonuclease HI|nr:ribonuclease HI [Bacillota bacterium]